MDNCISSASLVFYIKIAVIRTFILMLIFFACLHFYMRLAFCSKLYSCETLIVFLLPSQSWVLCICSINSFFHIYNFQMPKYVTQKEAIDLYFSMPGNVDLSTDDEEHEKTSQETRQTRSTSRNSGPEICGAEIVYVYDDSTGIDEGSGDEMSDSWKDICLHKIHRGLVLQHLYCVILE